MRLNWAAVNAPLEDLKSLYAAGQYERCWQGAHQALLAGRGDKPTFLLANMCLLRLDRGCEFAATIRNAGEHGALLCALTLSSLLQNETYAPLATVPELFSPDEPFWLVATYFSGCALLMLEQRAPAMARFRAFRLALPRFATMIDFIGDDDFNVMFRQGRLVADAEEVARRRKSEARVPMLEFAGEPQPGRPVVFASGNSHYFNAMAPEFVACMMPQLPPDTGLHIHVIDPDADSLALIEWLRTQHGGRVVLTLERPPLFRTYTYYSCSRFYVMAALLERYRSPILSFDIDIVPAAPVQPLFDVARPFDFCCFRTRRNEPASIFQASVMYWNDRPGTRVLLDDLRHFCWEELATPSRMSWMLDQAALFSLLTDPDSMVKFGDYRRLLDTPLEKLVRITFSNEIKGKLRQRGEQTGVETV